MASNTVNYNPQMNDITKDFIGVVELIQESRENAIHKVNEFVSSLLTQISWPNHLAILS